MDWSSAVCSSDLSRGVRCGHPCGKPAPRPSASQVRLRRSVAGKGDPGAEMQLRAVLQADFHRLAGIEFEHVARRCAARIGRAAVACRAGRHVALLRYQPALIVEVEDVRSEEHTSEPQSLMRISYAG